MNPSAGKRWGKSAEDLEAGEPQATGEGLALSVDRGVAQAQ